MQRYADQTIVIAAAALSSLFALGGAISFVLDRRRQADGWFASVSGGLAVWLGCALGLERLVGSRSAALVPLFAAPWICASQLGFARSYFRLKPSRATELFVIALGLASLVLGSAPFSRSRFALVACQFSVVLVYEAMGLGRLAREPGQRFDALGVLGAWAPLAISVAAPSLGRELLHVDTRPVASLILVVSQAALLLRRHMRELRTLKGALEDRVATLAERTHDARRLHRAIRLRIHDRSAHLAAALGQIGRLSGFKNRSFTVGMTIGERYTIVRRIGEGGMGAVYEVERRPDQKRFALKTLLAAYSGTWLARLAREAQAVATVIHPNVVAIVDLDVDASGMPFLVMELVQGESLGANMSRFGDPIFAREVVRQLAGALGALHDAGIVHRDLTPANVLIELQPGGQFRAKIVDLGIARVSAVDVEAATFAPTPRPMSGSLTRSGLLMGTPLYMAPELADGVKDASSSCDLWSLGVVAYQVACGRLPFLDPPVRWSRNGLGKPPAIDTGSLAEPFRAVVERCLKIDPAERPTAAEIVAALS
jgi:hypothetical protein